MSKKEDDGKLRVSTWRMILIFTILFLVMEAIFYVSFQSGNSFKPDIKFYIYTPIILVTSILFCVISIRSTFYKVDKHKLTHSKLGQVKDYYWKDILYVNEDWSKKHKMLLFYMSDGKDRYLAFDKDGIIFEYALKYSRMLSEEEFLARFPKAKL